MHSLGRIQLAFALVYFVLQGQTCLLLQVTLEFLLFIPIPKDEYIFFFFLVLVLGGLLSLYGTDRSQLLHRE